MSYKIILGIDPSGNKAEGSGCTGLCVLNCETSIATLEDRRAEDYKTQYQYWHSIVSFIKTLRADYGSENVFVVIEDYRLDPSRAAAQSYSAMETPKLIGVLQFLLCSYGISHMLQPASVVKKRWSDEILAKQNVFTSSGADRKRWYYQDKLTNDHKRDAFRHAWHVLKFRKWES